MQYNTAMQAGEIPTLPFPPKLEDFAENWLSLLKAIPDVIQLRTQPDPAGWFKCTREKRELEINNGTGLVRNGGHAIDLITDEYGWTREHAADTLNALIGPGGQIPSRLSLTSVKKYAAQHKLDPGRLAARGVTDRHGKVAVPYRNKDGTLLGTSYLTDIRAANQFDPSAKATEAVYGLDLVHEFTFDTVYVFWGEWNAHAATERGLQALALAAKHPGNQSWPRLTEAIKSQPAINRVVFLGDGDNMTPALEIKDHLRQLGWSGRVLSVNCGEVTGQKELVYLHMKAETDENFKAEIWKLIQTATDVPDLEPIQQGPKQYDCTDLGNGQRFVDQYRDQVKYSTQAQRFLSYDGKRWLRDKWLIHERLAEKTVKSILGEAKNTSDQKEAERLVKHFLRSSDRNVLEKMLRSARNKLTIDLEEMDADRYLFNVQNGTLELRDGTVRFRDHCREDMLMKLARVDFESQATCPQWLSFVAFICEADADLLRFRQKKAGYCLVGDNSEKAFDFVYGEGNTGKTTFIETIGDLMGDYCQHAKPETFMQQRANSSRVASPEIARLAGARLVIVPEVDRTRRLAEALLKTVTGGGDKITARHLNENEFDFEPQFKIFFHGNSRPRVCDDSDAFWNRCHVHHFRCIIPPSVPTNGNALKASGGPAIQQLAMSKVRGMFKQERPGILNWMLEGLRLYYAEGLVLPEKIVAARDTYRRSNDLLQAFFEAKCWKGEAPNGFKDVIKVKATQLYEAWRAYCRENDNDNRLSSTEFNEKVIELGFQTKRPGNAVHFYGVALKESLWWYETWERTESAKPEQPDCGIDSAPGSENR